MPATGLLLVLVGIFLLINVFNGNLINLVQGKIQFNFTSPSTTSSNSPVQKTQPDLTQTQKTAPGLTGNLNG